MGERSRPRRFLILFSNTGGGHRSPACAVAEALRRGRGEQAQVEVLDALVEYAPFPLDRLPSLYPLMVRMRAIPWAVGYALTDGPRRARLLLRSAWPWVRAATLRLLRAHPADVFLSCHPLLNHVVLWGLRSLGWRRPLFTQVIDLATGHALWYAPEVAACFAPTAAVRARALASGLPDEKVIVTGLPVRHRFLAIRDADPVVVRRRLGLTPDRPVVLVVGGADGMGRLLSFCRAIGRSVPQAQLVVVAGRNGHLQARLSAARWPLPVRAEGYVANMHEWMRAADLLVTKAGPSTIAEALTLGLPLILGDALPGQERPSVDYLLRAGAGIWAPTPAKAAQAVRALLRPGNPRRWEMSVRAGALARPDAAERVAAALWEAAQQGSLPRSRVEADAPSTPERPPSFPRRAWERARQ